MGPYAPAVAPSPGGRRQKPRERVRFVWQPYESFSQYNFHTMYSMKRKKKSRAENPLPEGRRRWLVEAAGEGPRVRDKRGGLLEE